jgi:hypothetical protein
VLDRRDLVAWRLEQPRGFPPRLALATRQSMYGGLIATDWQTGSLYMRRRVAVTVL